MSHRTLSRTPAPCLLACHTHRIHRASTARYRRRLMQSPENLKAAIDQALAVLPQELQPKQVPPPSPVSISPTSVMDAPACHRSASWADDDMDADELPPVRDLFESAERKRAISKEAKAAEAAEAAEAAAKAAAQPEGEPAVAFDVAFWMAQPTEETVEFVSHRLQEPQLRIVRAVVELLGAQTALDLLVQTERIQKQGGMIVEETGKPRTSGGIYLKLLKEADNLPKDEQEAAVLRIKVEGKKVKPSQKGKAGGSPNPRTPNPRTPSRFASSPASYGPPSATLGDFFEASRQQSMEA